MGLRCCGDGGLWKVVVVGIEALDVEVQRSTESRRGMGVALRGALRAGRLEVLVGIKFPKGSVSELEATDAGGEQREFERSSVEFRSSAG